MLFENILLPTAFADPSRRAAPFVRELARLQGSAIHVVHVVEDQLPVVLTSSASLIHTAAIAIPVPDQQEILDAARRDVAAFAKEEFPNFRTVTTHVIQGDIATGLAEEARRIRADLIVMGTHSKGIWHRIFHGSVGERVLELVDCPVLLIPIRGEVD